MKRCAEIAFLKLLTLSSLFLTQILSAQNIPIGSWRTHFSYSNARIIEKTSDKIFCATRNGLYSFNLIDNSTRKLSKIDGLADVDISAMEYNVPNNLLILGYRSGLVDFITEEGISSLREISTSNLEGIKRVNDIISFDNRTYLATALGIVVINNSEVTIRENYVQIGNGGSEVQVSEIELIDNRIFAKTNQGIQSGNVSDNLLDFNNWIQYSNTLSLEQLTIASQNLYARTNLDLYQFINDSWLDTNIDLPTGTIKMKAVDDKLVAFTNDDIFEFSGAQFDNVVSISAAAVNDVEKEGSQYFIADETLGLFTENGDFISPAGPLSDSYSRIKVLNNITYGFHSPSPSSYDGSIKIDGYSVFENGAWTKQEIPEVENVTDVIYFEGDLYFSSLGDGLVNMTKGEIITDIPLSDASPDTMITALTAGRNLWVSSYSNPNPIHSLNGGQWVSFSNSLLLDDQFEGLAVSTTGILWSKTTNGRLVVLDANENKVIALSSFFGQLEDYEISIEDDVWIATSNGPSTYPDASFIFNSDEIIQPSFEGNILFENDPINAIETDGGNRVWFGTDKGVWIFSANISEQVAIFNVDNSPLPSNSVIDFAYNELNGEMYILTEKGMVSYRSASSVGTSTHQNVNIFPNPVSPAYEGLVGIEGLAKNTTLKITDINGNLVKEIKADGSSASWDLRNVRNVKVGTGIYYFFSSTKDGTETYVGKIAVIR
jgi:hypothetical protein